MPEISVLDYAAPINKTVPLKVQRRDFYPLFGDLVINPRHIFDNARAARNSKHILPHIPRRHLIDLSDCFRVHQHHAWAPPVLTEIGPVLRKSAHLVLMRVKRARSTDRGLIKDMVSFRKFRENIRRAVADKNVCVKYQNTLDVQFARLEHAVLRMLISLWHVGPHAQFSVYLFGICLDARQGDLAYPGHFARGGNNYQSVCHAPFLTNQEPSSKVWTG
ncbi:MAG: hypothetical protein BWX80_03764 [Candidatus Hydrogenedentes bacterium ADurb.Bin101]|nr:MAG: hypothetical protein BWX80_03764 [Candidatus Hydrogenedentes bacterium ADurb.Bin101]